MRIAVISDIHGNCVALDAVLADIREQRVDQLVCLGDAIQGGAQPAETVARLRALACPVVMGNADAWLLTGEETGTEEVTERLAAVRAWSLSQLSAEDRAFIGNFQPEITVELGPGWRLLCFHGSPTSFDDIILPETPDDEAVRLLQPRDGQILTGGHTHRQQIRSLGTALFFNPGSVGFPYSPPQPDGITPIDPWAEYAIVGAPDEGRFALEFRRVPYDVAALRHSYETSGRPFADEEIAQYRRPS
ncbi:MAG TPA: metallophosphoesterase family protein [Ktedonobacterales bacterium]|nr:metallophosphoesterase family protein [Ktedonobacterales bacterium]